MNEEDSAEGDFSEQLSPSPIMFQINCFSSFLITWGCG